MSAIILEILKEHPNRIFTQTEIIEEIKKKTGKTKSKSAVSQNITTLSNKNKILYEKGIGRTPAKISLGITDKEKPKPKATEKPKPKATEKPKPKPIKKVELEFEKQAPDFEDYQLTALVSDKNNSKLEDQLSEAEETLKETLINGDYPDSGDKEYLSQAEKSLSDGIEEYNEKIKLNSQYGISGEPTTRKYSTYPDKVQILEETVVNQKEEIQNLEVEMAFVKGIRKRPFTFTEFSEYILARSIQNPSGRDKNSYSMGEIKFRRSGLKNIYLMILHLRDESKL